MAFLHNNSTMGFLHDNSTMMSEMSKFNVSEITFAEAPLELCNKMGANVYNVLRGLKGLRLTIESLRPDEKPEKVAVVEAINEAVIPYAACVRMLRNVRISLKSEDISGQAAVDALQALWSAVQSELDNVRCKVLKAIEELMLVEMTHVGVVQGLLMIFFGYFKIDETMEDVEKAKTLSHISVLTKRWLDNSQLFIEAMPHYLDPERFFQAANAIYYALSSEFEFIVAYGDREKYIMFHLNNLAASFVDLGGIGIQSLMVLSNDTANQMGWLEDMLGWDGETSLTQEEIQKLTLATELKIDESQLSPYAIEKAELLMANVTVRYYNDFFVLELFKLVVGNSIKAAKTTYIQMRRTLFHILSLAFPPNQLLTKAQESMFELKNYFLNCLEVLSMCKQAIALLKSSRKSQSMSIEHINSTFVKNEAYHSALGMGEPYLDDCKKAVRKLVNDDYAMSKAVIRQAMVEFVAIASAKIAETGMHPLQLNSTYARFREAVSTYMGIMIELQNVGTLEESTWLMTGGRGMDEAKAELISLFNRCYESLNGLQGRKRPTTWWFVLQRLPVTESLKEEVRFKSGTLPFSTQPETYKTTLPRPVKPVYLQIEVFDVKNLNIPEQDIVANEEFKKFF